MLGPVAPILYVPDVILFEIVEFVTVSDVATIVPSVAVPVEAVMLEPNVTAPSWSGIVAVEIVAVLAESVPMVAVPVDAVMLEPKVTAPSWSGIVAVLIEAVEIVAVESVTEGIVAVLIVAVPTERVPMVAVPVDAVRLVPKVTIPERRLVPSTAREPVLLTSEVERDNADEMLFPLVMA